MKSPRFEFTRSHTDRLDGVPVRVTITTLVEQIPAPDEPGGYNDRLAAYIIGGGDPR